MASAGAFVARPASKVPWTLSEAIDTPPEAAQPVADASAPRRTLLLHLAARLGIPAGALACVPALLLGVLVVIDLVLEAGERPPERLFRAGVVAAANLLGSAYAFWFTQHAIRRCGEDLQRLQHCVDLSPEALASFTASLGEALGLRMRALVLAATLGMFLLLTWRGGLADGFIGLFAPPRFPWEAPVYLLLWLGVFHAAAIALRIAWRLAHFTRTHVVVDLLATDALEPVTLVGARLGLLAVGGLLLIPLQAALLGQMAVGDWLPSAAVVATLGASLVCWPMWSVHVAIRDARDRELVRIAEALGYRGERTLEELVDPRMQSLLQHRDRVRRVDAWPLSRSSGVRLLAYIVVPPLAWAGAALIELAVDRLVQ